MSRPETPLQAVRQYCIACCGGDRGSVNGPAGCNSPRCSLFHLRTGKRVPAEAAHRSQMRPEGGDHLGRMKCRAARSVLAAVRLRCLDCCGGSPADVAACDNTLCALHALRFGKRPETVRRQRQKLDDPAPHATSCPRIDPREEDDHEAIRPAPNAKPCNRRQYATQAAKPATGAQEGAPTGPAAKSPLTAADAGSARGGQGFCKTSKGGGRDG